MKIENRQAFLVVLTIAAASLLIGDRLVFEPLAGLWSSRSAEVRDLRKNVMEGRALVLRELSLHKQWDQMRANAFSVNPSVAEQQMLRSFDDWSRNSGAEITSIIPQWKSDSTNYTTLSCRVEASGSISGLSQLLYNIKKGPAAIRVDSIELSSHDNAGQQLTLGLQVSGLVLLATQ